MNQQAGFARKLEELKDAFADDRRFIFRGNAVGVARQVAQENQPQADESAARRGTVWASISLPGDGGIVRETQCKPRDNDPNQILSFESTESFAEGLMTRQGVAQTQVKSEVEGLEIRLPEYDFVFKAPHLTAAMESEYDLEQGLAHPDEEFAVVLKPPGLDEGMTINGEPLKVAWSEELVNVRRHKDLKKAFWKFKESRSESVRRWLGHFSGATLKHGLFGIGFRKNALYSIASLEGNQFKNAEFKWHRAGVPDLKNPVLELRFGEVVKSFNSTRLTVIRAILHRRPEQLQRPQMAAVNRALASNARPDRASGSITVLELESNGKTHP